MVGNFYSHPIEIKIFFYIYPQGDQQDEKYFNLYWMRIKISYHIFNNLSEIVNIDLSAKIGRKILSKDLMDRECNCSITSKVNGKCVYEGKCQSKCLIHEVKCLMCDAIYIDNTQQTLKN